MVSNGRCNVNTFKPHPNLENIAANGLSNASRVPWEAILENSAYYPASGLDADPIRICAHAIRSFVYCSYGISSAEFQQELRTVGFKGYRIVFQRALHKYDLVPPDWRPALIPKSWDGNLEMLRTEESGCELFGHWSIWNRGDNGHWFSFVFISGEACAVLQGLYLHHGISPLMLCLIQPGEAMGGNWTNFFARDGFMHRLMQASGMPRYLLTGGYHGRSFHDQCCWPGYDLIDKPQPSFKPTRFGIEGLDVLVHLFNPSTVPSPKPTLMRGFGQGKVLRLWCRNESEV